ncbi:MAG: glycosyltransferase [Candidatus Methylomirabilales bacterium]
MSSDPDPKPELKPNPDLSLVLACYNEGPVLAESLPEILAVLDGTRLTYEIVLVDDGSSDGTAEEIRRLLAAYPRAPMRATFHPRNLGRGATVADGIRVACGRLVGFLDVDLEVSARYIPDLVRVLERGADVAVGFRIYRLTPRVLHRWVLSKGYVGLVRWLLDVPLRDTESGCKFFRRDRILPVLAETEDPGWFWDTEIMVRSLRAGLRIVEVPVLFFKRPEVPSRVRLVRDSVTYFHRLWKFRRHIRQEPAADPTKALRTVYGSAKSGKRQTWEIWRRRTLTATCRQRAFDRLSPLSGRRILELGSGPGEEARDLADRGGWVVALDLVRPPIVLGGRGENGLVVPVLADAQSLPFRAGSFDAIFGQAMLMHVDPDRVMKECHRVLRPGGKAIFIEPLRYHPLVTLYRLLLSPFSAARPRYLTLEQIEAAGQLFTAAHHDEHHLLSVLWAGDNGGSSALERLDRWLLRRWPPLRRYCWTTVLEFTR